MPITIDFSLKAQTKTCYRFDCKDGDTFITLYLKKTQVNAAGIDAQKGVTATIKQKEEA